MDGSIFEILTENALNERMDNILLHNEEYQKVQNEISQYGEKFQDLNLTKEQSLIVDRLIASYTKSGCCYGRIAYQQGIRDCALLLREMELIK